MKQSIKKWILNCVIIILFLGICIGKYFVDNLYAEGQRIIEERKTLTAAELITIVDGDTVKVKIDEEELTVRLIGVDAPESVHRDPEKNSEYGKLASEFTSSFLKNYDRVYLQYDKERQDQYDRELCYVWLSDDINVMNSDDIDTYMFNAILLQQGYAEDISYYPNIYYAEHFEVLCADARAKQIGLWGIELFMFE